MNKRFIAFYFCFFSFAASAQNTFDEKNFHEYLQINKNNISSIEGIWKIQISLEYYHFDTLLEVVKSPADTQVAVKKEGNKFNTYSMNGTPFDIEFMPTDINGVFLYRNYFPDISEYSKLQAVIVKNGEFEITYDSPREANKVKQDKMPKENMRIVNIYKWNRFFPSN